MILSQGRKNINATNERRNASVQEFISGDKNCRDEIIKTIYDTANQFQDLEKGNIEKVRNRKINEFEEILQYRFGKNPNKFWKNLFRDIYI